MGLQLSRIEYSKLNNRQKESYNFQKVSAVLAEYGYITHRLSDDWQGADFIAQHIDGEIIKVQLKGRLSFNKKYCDKNLYICFPDKGSWYLYPHDEILVKFIEKTLKGSTIAWSVDGDYHSGSLSKQAKELLEPYRIHEK